MDTATFVVDAGSWSFKCGVTGDDRPRVIIPSSVGVKRKTVGTQEEGGPKEKVVKSYLVGKTELGNYDEALQVRESIEKGRVVDWDGFESLLSFSTKALLGETQVDRRFLFAEQHDVEISDREKLTELVFEKFDAKSLFTSKSAPLNLYACARSTGIVLDIGADSSRASVVIDGFLHRDSIKTVPLGGRLLVQTLLDRVENELKIGVTPRFRFSKKSNRDGTKKITLVDAPAHATYIRFWKLDIMAQMLTDVCKISPVSLALQQPEAQDVVEQDKDEYVLPDGTVVSGANKIGLNIAELLVDPRSLNRSDIPMGVAEMVLKSAQSISNAENRKDVIANVVVCGGPTAMTGLPERIAGEIVTRSRGTKSRLIVGGLQERQYNAWIGGSILGTLNSLSDLWVTKQEYDEHGSKALNRKCP